MLTVPRIMSSLKTEAGRKKVIICVSDMVPLHGKDGDSEIVGILECNKLVKEFQKLKLQTGDSASKSEGISSGKADGISSASPADANAEAGEEEADKNADDDVDDLSIAMPGGHIADLRELIVSCDSEGHLVVIDFLCLRQLLGHDAVSHAATS